MKYLVEGKRCSERRACALAGISRSVARYRARKLGDEDGLARKIHELAIRHSRYGYRRITVLLRREGIMVNKKRVHRIWKQEGLSLPLRRPRRRRRGLRVEMVNKAEYRNHVWSYDFVEDRTERGGKLRCLVIIDEFTRECLALVIRPSIPAARVVEVLEQLFLLRGVPKYLRSDNGPEFIARVVTEWLEANECSTIFISPGSPWENGYIESFIDKFRDECLNCEVFQNWREAQVIAEAWRQEYNNYRPHSSLDYLTPAEFARQYPEKNSLKENLTREKAGTVSF